MNPDQTINLNQNAAQCIQTASSFGHTAYTNICNGQVHIVEWGGIDWVISILAILFVCAVLSAFIRFVFD